MTTTNQIADTIATEQSLTKAQAKAIVDRVFTQITQSAASGAETSVPGFGKLEVKATPEREGRHRAKALRWLSVRITKTPVDIQ